MTMKVTRFAKSAANAMEWPAELAIVTGTPSDATITLLFRVWEHKERYFCMSLSTDEAEDLIARLETVLDQVIGVMEHANYRID